MDIMIIVQRESQLLEVVSALGSSSGFSGLLDRRQHQRHQNRDDRNHDQKLNQSKRAVSSKMTVLLFRMHTRLQDVFVRGSEVHWQ